MSTIRFRHTSSVTLLAAVSSLVSTPALAQTCDLPQQEMPVTCIEGQVMQLEYGSYTSGGTISPATDIDVFEFSGTAGDIVQVVMHGTTAWFDPRIEVVDPASNFIHDQWCTGNSTCSFAFDLTLEMTGTYTLIASDAGSPESGNYTLQLERIPPPEAAPTLLHNVTVSDTISPTTDLDFLAIEAVAGSIIRVTVLGTTAWFDPCLTWMSPAGELTPHSCNGNSTCSFTFDQPISESGTYHLLLSDCGRNETGGYQVTVECLLGDCHCLAADFDDDHVVGVSDLITLMSNWGMPCTADFVAPAGVGVEDLVELIGNWGACP